MLKFNVHYATSGNSGRTSSDIFLSRRHAIVLAVAFLLCIIFVPVVVHLSSKTKCDQLVIIPTTQMTTTQKSTPKTSAAPLVIKDLRLPTDVKPIHYSLTLAPFIYSSNTADFYFHGSVNISVQVIKATNNFKLHTNKLTISSIYLTNIAGNRLVVNSVEEDSVRQWQSVTMMEELQAGRNYTIVIDRFKGPLKPDLQGLYVSSYVENGAKKYLVASQLQATDARKVFPCFDEPAFKATFDISLVKREDFKAISNMPSKAVRPVSAGNWFNSTSGLESTVKEDFETTPIMSTYLLAFIVAQFNYTFTSDIKGRLFRTWARPERTKSTECANEIARNITMFFERYFDIEYPLPKTDQAAVSDFAAGAMENWGLILYRETYLVCNADYDRTESLQLTAAVIGHELGHMWFGNLVTPQWWDDLWLNEGFASFVEYLAVEQLHAEWDMDAQFVSNEMRQGYQADSVGASHPVYVEVNNPDEIGEIFDDITYNKGSSVLRMLYNSLGDEVFRVGVSNYLKNNSYSNTFHTALYQSLTQQARERGSMIDVGEVMDRWIKQMGYPVLNCTREPGQLFLSQQHFLSDPTQMPDPRYPSPFDFTWIIPVTMATMENASSLVGSDTSHLVQWMRHKSQTFVIDNSSWYLLNLRSSGFYRVNYDTENWNALISQLISNHSVFTPHDRARLLDDSFTLASAGYISYRIPLEMTRYLKNETHLVPWQSALSKLSYIHSMLHRQSPEYGPFSAYMRSLLTPMYESVGTQKKSSDSHLTQMTREMIVSAACRFGMKSCKSNVTSLFQSFIRSDYKERIEPDIRRSVLCVGIASSDSEVWYQLFRVLQRETHPGIQNDIIRALGCSREPWVLSRYLSFTLDDSKIRRQDASVVIVSVAKNPIGLQIVWDFLRSQWIRIQTRQSGLFSLSRYIKSLSGFNSVHRLQEMEAFKFEILGSLASATRAMDSALENVRINAKWMENNVALLGKYFSALLKSI